MPRDIEAFFIRYRDAFNALDGEAVARLYAEPSGIAQDAVYTHWPSRQAVAENMQRMCALYRQKGFVRADFQPQRFIDQGEHHAFADLHWTIGMDAGQAPWQFRTSYNLVRTSEGWRVLLCTAYSEPALLNAARS